MWFLAGELRVKKQEKSTILLENRACAVMFFVNVFALSYFQVACLHAYVSLRSQNVRRLMLTERIADSLFILGMFLMGLVCVIITYDLV